MSIRSMVAKTPYSFSSWCFSVSFAATGLRQDISGNWLAAASTVGAPIPSQIAAQLAGREFATFDKFREAFWRVVGQDPLLIEYFRPENTRRMQKGYAPFARNDDWVGQRRRLELHHEVPIFAGGKVYDMDNLKVTTPKVHVGMHGGKGE